MYQLVTQNISGSDRSKNLVLMRGMQLLTEHLVVIGGMELVTLAT